MTKPFDVMTLRFSRGNPAQPSVLDIRQGILPIFPDVDWDSFRDSSAETTSAIAVIAPELARLTVNVRFQRLGSNQIWDVWAEDHHPTSVLPEVKPIRLCENSPGCVTREVEFQVDASRIQKAGIGQYAIDWQWSGQKLDPRTLKKKGEPQCIGVTRFVVYALAGRPVFAPWMQLSNTEADRDLPRVAILDWACEAAAGARTPTDAATRVTKALYALGSNARLEQGKRRFVYGSKDDFVCGKEHHLFRGVSFVEAVNETGPVPVAVSCEDLATAVCVFANALGADLYRERISLKDSKLTRIRPIGQIPMQPVWFNHVFARSSGRKEVFDACVQLSVASDDECWESPVAMPLDSYLDRLLTQKPHPQPVSLRAPVLDRPAVESPGDGVIADAQRFYLEQLSRFTPATDLPQPNVLATLGPPSGFKLEGFEDRGWSARAVWVSDHAAVVLSVEVEIVDDPEIVVEFAAWNLTFYRDRMMPRDDHRFPGAICCATDDEKHFVVVFRNGLLVLRSDGPATSPPATILLPILVPVVVPPAVP